MNLYYVIFSDGAGSASAQFFASRELALLAEELNDEVLNEGWGESTVSSITIHGDNVCAPEAITKEMFLRELPEVCDTDELIVKYTNKVNEL